MARKARTARQVKADIFDDGDDPQARPKRGLGWLLFRAPGAFILWWRYYFAKRGNVALSARQKGNAVMEVGYSLAFWGMILWVAALLYLMMVRPTV
jgi:hypothetical protein